MRWGKACKNTTESAWILNHNCIKAILCSTADLQVFTCHWKVPVKLDYKVADPSKHTRHGLKNFGGGKGTEWLNQPWYSGSQSTLFPWCSKWDDWKCEWNKIIEEVSSLCYQKIRSEQQVYTFYPCILILLLCNLGKFGLKLSTSFRPRNRFVLGNQCCSWRAKVISFLSFH